MFAPPVARPLTKSAVRTSDSRPLQHLSRLRTGDWGHEHGRVPAVVVSASGEPPASHWNFAKIPVCAPERAEGQPPMARSMPRAQPDEKPPAKPPRKDEPPEGKRDPADKPPAKAPAAPSATIANETVAIDPGPRTRTKIAVGEEVTLTYSAGNANWQTTAGTLSAKRGVSVTLTAPDTARTVTVTAGKATITFDVIAPKDVLMERYPSTGISHTKDRPDIGMLTTAFLQPDTVNFYNIKHREVDARAFATGVYKPFDGIGHDANPKTIRMQDVVVAGKGTQSRIQDKVCSGDPATLPPFETGQILYVIPYEYQVGTGPFHRFTSVVQMCTLTSFDPSKPEKADLYAYKAVADALTTVGAASSNTAWCVNPPPSP
jgi:hypothetical protein